MILEGLQVAPAEFERRTGWSIKPRGACKGERCVPLPPQQGASPDARVLAERLGMPLVHDDASGLWCLGPEASGRALTSVEAPDLALPDVAGRMFRLGSLRGTKVLLLAWASW
ncbi:MAG: hypothetical protein JOZ81_28315 [Chloroflexi bacterium]|nr:hypothetical protein [Chloroflexota bacterium]MBV9547554.1 hypothetical protein [Chloroflexota bacterium]